MKKQITGILTLFLVFTAFSISLAQQTNVSGQVIGEDSGEPLIGATVLVEGTTIGTTTDLEGNFRLDVPSTDSRIVVRYIGYTHQTFSADDPALNKVALKRDALGLDEIVVTGVASGTSQRKLGFTVAKVNEDQLNKVPGSDPANALRGKVSGVRVVSPSGDPANATEIRLRGSTTISGSQRPLIIMDGIIIEGGDLRDINMEDVESIEVVKGAAAASLYGSLAGNGVVQITTKKGKAGQPFQVNVRSEIGTSSLANEYPLSTRHDYALDSNGDFVFDSNGRLTYDPDNKKDNLYPYTYNNEDIVYNNQAYWSLNTNLSGSLADLGNYFVSYQKSEQGGIVDGFEPFEKDNVRLNMQVKPIKQLSIKTSASYNTQNGYNANEYGQGGSNAFYSVLSAEPFINFGETDADGKPAVVPSGYNITPTSPNYQNPLYFNNVITRNFDRNRLLGSITVDYSPTEWLTLSGQRTLDNLSGKFRSVTPKEFESPSPGNINGSLSEYLFNTSAEITSFQATFLNTAFAGLNTKVIAKVNQEEYERDYESYTAENFLANEIYTYQNAETFSAETTYAPERNRSALLDATFDWKDKIIINGNVRREGSSLNSESTRAQTFGRGAIAYILTDDVDMGAVNFLKLRASYGTAGNRPRFGSIYETLAVNQTGINFGQTGAVDLQASTIKETEIGFDMGINDRVNIVGTFSNSDTENDVLVVDLPLGFGYTRQSRNIGSINNKVYELGINAIVVDNSDWNWDVNFNWDKINQEITDLGTLPPFTRDTGNAVNLFRVEAGQPYGTMYGNKLVTSLDQLVTDVNGEVINQYSGNAVAGGSVNDYEVNSDGYVVRRGTFGTEDEKQLLMVDEEGNLLTESIGNTNPNFNIGFASTLMYKNFTLYGLLDYQNGGDVYNYTKQLLYFRDRHADQDEFGIAGHHKRYSDGNSTLYNAGNPIDHFVEDGSYLKIREISLGYDVDGKFFNMGNNFIKGARIALTGRNLFTFSDYSGYDPEVAINQNPTNFRLDEYAYPNYRTFTGRIELTF